MHASIAHELGGRLRAGAGLLRLALAVACALVALPATAVAQDGERNGLKGEYYVSSAPGAFDFHELKATVVNANIDFPDLNGDLQELTGQNNDAAVRWTGRLVPEFSEAYRFSMIGDNGFRLWIDDQLVVDHWVDDWDVEQVSEPVMLEAGREYDIKVEYFENFGGASLRLRWESASQPKEIIPSEALLLPEGFDPAGPRMASLAADGETLTVDFGGSFTRVPASAADHFTLTVAGTEWPIDSVRVGDDPSQLVVELSVPVPQPATSLRLAYDGKGRITDGGGALAAFPRAAVVNNSEYLIRTRWADDVDPDNPLPEYPRPQMRRNQWKSLNGTWDFAAVDEIESMPTEEAFDERIVVPYPVESRLSGIERREDRMWYRRTFTVPSGWGVGRRDERLMMHFDAVDFEAVVYVNGHKLTTHRGGFERFSVDVTDALRRGRNQELMVAVADSTDQGLGGFQVTGKQRLNPGAIFYTPASGIWQTVWMEPVSSAHVTSVELDPNPEGESLAVRVEADGVTNELAVVTARDGNRTVGWTTGPANRRLRVRVPRPKLWSPERPFLYDLDVKLIRPGRHNRRVDDVDSYFGMRSVEVAEVAGENRILLNGEPVFNMGPLDQGFWPDGIYTPPTDEALRYDLEETKRLGFNTVRKHIKVESDRWFYWADKLGLMVWQDMPSMARTPPPDSAIGVRVSGENTGGGEVGANLVDGSAQTKWLVLNSTGWVELQPPRAVAVNRYSLTSANDFPGRDPKDWTLSGSNDGKTWTELDRRSGEAFAERFQKREFTFENSTAYRHYRLDITSNGGENIVQLAEFELAGVSNTPAPPGDGENPDDSAPLGPRAQFEAELRGMIEQHRSHPSIIMWVPFNEGWGQYDQARIADMVKDWDPDRLVNNMSGINCCGAVDGGNGDVIDYHIYPGPGAPGGPTETRAAVIGEYGGLGLPVLGHTWSGGGWGYAFESNPQALTERYVEMADELRELQACNGLSGAIYTQTTDIETELNGLITYDRALTKVRIGPVRRANERLIAESAYVGRPGNCTSSPGARTARKGKAANGSRKRVQARTLWDPASRR